MIPIAAFLAGALLSLLLPVGLLIALAGWYWLFSARVHETSEAGGAGAQPITEHPAIPESLPPDPAV